MLSRFGIGELLVLLVVVLLIFGPKRLPELASSLGKSIKHFKDAVKEGSDDSTTSGPKDSKPS